MPSAPPGCRLRLRFQQPEGPGPNLTTEPIPRPPAPAPAPRRAAAPARAQAKPIHPIVLKAYMRRSSALSAIGRFGEAKADLEKALRLVTDEAQSADGKELRRLLRGVEAERRAAEAEAAALGVAADAPAYGGGGGSAERTSLARVHTICDALQASAPLSPAQVAAAAAAAGDSARARTESAGAAGSAAAAGCDGGGALAAASMPEAAVAPPAAGHGASAGMRRIPITAEADDDDSEEEGAQRQAQAPQQQAQAQAAGSVGGGVRRIPITTDTDDEEEEENKTAGQGQGQRQLLQRQGGERSSAAGAPVNAAAAPPAPPAPPTPRAESAAERAERECALLRELRQLLLLGDGHRATARACGLVGWLCSKLAAAPPQLPPSGAAEPAAGDGSSVPARPSAEQRNHVGLEAARALAALCLSPRAQKECVQRGGVDRLLLLLGAEPAIAPGAGAAPPVAAACADAAGPAASAAAEQQQQQPAHAHLERARAAAAAWELAEHRLDILRLCSATEALRGALVGAICSRHFLGRLAALADGAADGDGGLSGGGDGGRGAPQGAAAGAAGVGGPGTGGALGLAIAAASAARADASLSALALCANLSADPKMKAALGSAAVDGSGGAAAQANSLGGAQLLGLLARALGGGNRSNGAGKPSLALRGSAGSGDARAAAAGRGVSASSSAMTPLAAQRQRLAVEAVGNLSSAPRLRALFAQLGAGPAVRDAALRALGTAAGASRAECAAKVARLEMGTVCFLANAAAALHNLCADDEGARACVLPLLGALSALLARGDVTGDADLSGRFLALMGKGARLEGAAAMLRADGAFEMAAAMLDASARGPEGVPKAAAGPALAGAGAPAGPAPRFEEVTEEAEPAAQQRGNGAPPSPHGGAHGASSQPAEPNADGGAAAEAGAEPVFDVVGPALKLLTVLLQADNALAAAVCERGSIPTLVRCGLAAPHPACSLARVACLDTPCCGRALLGLRLNASLRQFVTASPRQLLLGLLLLALLLLGLRLLNLCWSSALCAKRAPPKPHRATRTHIASSSITPTHSLARAARAGC